MIRLFQVKCANENEIEAQILKKLRIRKEDLLQWHVHRKSVDARHQKVLFSYVVDCKVKNEKKLLQAKHRLEEAEMRDRQKERKARTRRLIQEGAILEKVLPQTTQMTLEQLEDFLCEVFKPIR